MEHNRLLPAESLIPQRRPMGLIDWVKGPTQKSLQGETTVTEAWPLNQDGKVSSLICVELVAQAICALSTWRRGEGAKPRIGLLVGVKKAEFSYSSIPVMTRLFIQIDELYSVGAYAVFQGEVSSELDVFCKTTIQVMEPEENGLSNLIASQRIEGRENGGL